MMIVEDLQASHWRLARFHDHDERSALFRRYFDRGFIGWTISNVSPYEKKRIRASFVSAKSKSSYVETNRSQEYLSPIGELWADDMTFWFQTQQEYDDVVSLVESMPKREHLMLLDHGTTSGRQLASIKRQMIDHDLNYWLIEGSDKNAISFAGDDTIAVWLKLAFG